MKISDEEENDAEKLIEALVGSLLKKIRIAVRYAFRVVEFVPNPN